MKLVFSVHDRVSDSWQDPILARTEAEACRGFMISCCDPRIPEYYLHDISLYRIGEFDEASGEIIPCKPVRIYFGDAANVIHARERIKHNSEVGGNDNEISHEAVPESE